MPLPITVTNYPNTFNQIVGIVNNIFNQDSQTVSALTNFSANPSYVFVNALRQTMHNLCDLLDASLFYHGLNTVSSNLQQISALPLSISAQDQDYLETRTEGIGTSMAYLASTFIFYPQNISTLFAGNPIIPEIGYLEYMSQFNAETPPTNVSSSSTIISSSTDESAAWLRIQAAANQSTVSFEPEILDTLTYLNEIQSTYTNFLSTYIPLSNSLPVSTVWNYSVALPIYEDLSNIYWNDPSNALIQNCMILRYTLKQTELTCAQLLLAFMNQVSVNIQTAQLMQFQSLLDLANTSLGDYTQWEAIAQANGLLPPYISPTPSLNMASPGSNLYLPGATPQGNPGNYNINFLGSDLNFGIPGGSMPPWGGDFETVNGLTNLQYALGRRLLTAFGNLIYHPSYGSMILNYVGQPMTIASISVLLGYAQSSLLADPRVATVLNLGANLINANQLYIASSVQVAGGPSKSTNINVILQPGAIAQTGN